MLNVKWIVIVVPVMFAQKINAKISMNVCKIRCLVDQVLFAKIYLVGSSAHVRYRLLVMLTDRSAVDHLRRSVMLIQTVNHHRDVTPSHKNVMVCFCLFNFVQF